MTLQQLKRVHQGKPFKPFLLRLVDGKEYEVKHPEFLSFSQSGRTVVVATPDDAHEIIDVFLVASIYVGNGRKDGRKGNGKGQGRKSG